MPEKRLTVQEFAEQFNFNEEYVRRMIRQDVDPRTGRVASLPESCRAVKIGRQYFVFVDTDEHITAKGAKEFQEVGSVLSTDQLSKLLVERWSQSLPLIMAKKRGPALAEPARFMGLLERCYTRAVDKHKSIKFNIVVKPDGEWEMEADPSSDLLLALVVARRVINEDLAWCFAMTWLEQAYIRASTGTSSTAIPDSSPVDNAFLKRCLHCGVALTKVAVMMGDRYHTKSNSKLDCRDSHKRQIIRWTKKDLTERAELIVDRVKAISTNF